MTVTEVTRPQASARTGLFGALERQPADALLALRTRHCIYMGDSGRINIAGLRRETVAPFISAIAPHLQR